MFKTKLLALFILIIPFLCQGKELSIGLEIEEVDRVALEKTLNEELKEMTKNHGFHSIKVINFSSYKDRYYAFHNNEVEILETTYNIYYEANTVVKMNVILHSCYPSSGGIDQFYSSGLIIANKGDKISLDDQKKITRIYAVDKHSSTGYFLQQQHLTDEGINLPLRKFSFTGHSHNILEKVKSTPGSIGMCGNFLHPDENEFDILYKSPVVPGQVVIAPEAMPSEIIKMVQDVLVDFSVKRYRSDDKQRYFFAYPLKDDYRAYLDLYNTEHLTMTVKIMIGFLIVAVVTIFMISGIYIKSKHKSEIENRKISKENEKLKKENADVVNKLKEDLSINAICQKLSAYSFNPIIANRLNDGKINHFLNYYATSQYREAIRELTGDLEMILPEIISKIKEVEGRQSQKNDVLNDLITKPKLNDLHAQVNSFHDFCGKLRRLLKDTHLPNSINYDSPFEDKLTCKLIPLASLDGSVQHLYIYRNFSTHEHKIFLTSEDAETVLKNYLHFYQKIGESELFEEVD